MNAHISFDLDWTNATFRQHRPHLFCVESAFDCSLKGTLKLLLVLILSHLAPQIGQFSRRNNAALTRLQHHVEPSRIALGALVKAEKLVFALRRPNECGPAATICQHRSNNNASGLSAPYRRIMEPLTRSTRSSDSFGGFARRGSAYRRR